MSIFFFNGKKTVYGNMEARINFKLAFVLSFICYREAATEICNWRTHNSVILMRSPSTLMPPLEEP